MRRVLRGKTIAWFNPYENVPADFYDTGSTDGKKGVQFEHIQNLEISFDTDFLEIPEGDTERIIRVNTKNQPMVTVEHKGLPIEVFAMIHGFNEEAITDYMSMESEEAGTIPSSADYEITLGETLWNFGSAATVAGSRTCYRVRETLTGKQFINIVPGTGSPSPSSGQVCIKDVATPTILSFNVADAGKAVLIDYWSTTTAGSPVQYKDSGTGCLPSFSLTACVQEVQAAKGRRCSEEFMTAVLTGCTMEAGFTFNVSNPEVAALTHTYRAETLDLHFMDD